MAGTADAFWSTLPSTARWLALGLLGGLTFAALVTYVALLGAVVSPRIDVPGASRRDIADTMFDLLRCRPGRLVATAVLIFGWLIVLVSLPTLGLIGSGLVPALLTRLVVQSSDRSPWPPMDTDD